MLIELKLACNAAAVKIKDGRYNFHQENTLQSLAKIVPALKAKLNHISPIPKICFSTFVLESFPRQTSQG